MGKLKEGARTLTHTCRQLQTKPKHSPTCSTSALQKFLKSCSPSRWLAASLMAARSREPSCAMKYLYSLAPQLNLFVWVGGGGWVGVGWEVVLVCTLVGRFDSGLKAAQRENTESTGREVLTAR
jgi:hypothetical protein